MNAQLSIREIQGERLTAEQTAYLDGMFAGLQNRGVRFADVEPNPAGAPRQDLETLILEERVKRELHPLDSYPALIECAESNSAPEKENIFRFKWHGLFYLTPRKEAFMARLRIPGGQLKTFQLRELAAVSRDLTTGYVQVTSRANIQLRLIEPRNAPEVLRRIQSVGLNTRGTGADNIRNITTHPTAGIDRHELLNTLPLCQQLADIIQHDRSFFDLPRKFNIALDGGGSVGVLEDGNDIGLKAVRLSESAGSLPPGVYFRVALGGATGHKTFARDLGVLVKPEQALKVVVALIRVFIANGNRGDRKKARLKHLLEGWSLERYLEETESLLGFRLARSSELAKTAITSEEKGRRRIAHPHVGVFGQKQAGLNYVGVGLPVGEITPKQMFRLADLADHYGSGEARLTVWQNVIIPNVPDGFVEPLKKALVRMGLDWRQSNLRSGIVACTGNSYCKFAAANTKRHGLELGLYLEKRLELDQPLNIHVTGCPNSCAQHYIGDIGLLGTQVKVGGEPKEAYHVFVGGGFGENQAVGRQVFHGISFEQLKPTLEKMLRAYLRHRAAGESFQDFAKRHDLNALQTLFSE